MVNLLARKFSEDTPKEEKMHESKVGSWLADKAFFIK